jgi:hypothetical protein
MKEQSIMEGEKEKLIFNGSNVSYSAISGMYVCMYVCMYV